MYMIQNFMVESMNHCILHQTFPASTNAAIVAETKT